MDYRRFGTLVRAIRRRSGLRQADVAARAGVSRRTVSRVERGECAQLSFATADRVAAALGVSLRLEASWRGAEGDRLVDSRHSALVEEVVRTVRDAGWETRVEYSFARYGERGRVDVLGWPADVGALLIVEVKDDFGDVQDTIGRLDVKGRVVPITVRDDFGWRPRVVGVVLVLQDRTRLRHIVASRAAFFDAALPGRTVDVARWLRRPAAPLRAIWFVRGRHGAATTRRPAGETRVRRSRTAPPKPPSRSPQPVKRPGTGS